MILADPSTIYIAGHRGMVGSALVRALEMAAAADAKACVDLKTMDSGQKSIRESLKFTEKAADPAKTCGSCGFFTPTTEGCGTCMIFTGPANSMGHCDAWSAKS